MADDLPSNNLRADWYRWLLPTLIEQDQNAPGIRTPLNFYDNASGEFTKYDQDGFLYDVFGVKPVIQTMFAVFETAAGEDLKLLEGLSALVDPDTVPQRYLATMADSLGRKLPENLTEEQQREFVRSIIATNKSRGRPLSWEIFFRQLGYGIQVHPLFKKDIKEAHRRYARTRFPDPIAVTDSPLSVIIGKTIEGSLTQKNIVPGTVLLQDLNEVFKDDGAGGLRSLNGAVGTIDYVQGTFFVTFTAAVAGPTSAAYQYTVDPHPFVAARVDLDVYLVPLTGGDTPVVDDNFLAHVLETIEDVRPIHILVRILALVMVVDDSVDDMATDDVCCGPETAIDIAYPGPTWVPLTPTALQKMFLGDKAPVCGDNEFRITRSDGADNTVSFDEVVAGFTNPRLDTLVITSTPAQPNDGYY